VGATHSFKFFVNKSSSEKPSICIISHFAYGAMTGDRRGHIGGVEWQTSITAKWLAAKGYSVSMITWNEGGPAEEWIDGVRLIKICRHDDGVPGVRFLHPRWTSLITALRQANADVYYHNCGESTTGQIALWCRLNHRGFVFSSANDTDCDVKLPEFSRSHERVLYRYALRKADHLVVQTEKQRLMLETGFGLKSTPIPMPCPGPGENEFSLSSKAPSQRILWIARVTEQKRPDRLMDVAAACPDLSFDFVGPANTSAYAQEVISRARALSNVTVHGGVPRERVREFYQQAGCLCCTSDYEGFPNTFLEAWSYGLPIVSTFDPDGLIEKRRLGFTAQDVPGIISGLRKLFASQSSHNIFAENARRYYLGSHAVEIVLPQFEQIFCSVFRSSGRFASVTNGAPVLEVVNSTEVHRL
jgi:glycosyltransferase involved in cell wall biosynthesis